MLPKINKDDHPLEIGRKLIEAKDILPFGEFIPWRKKNVHVCNRMAQRYMSQYRMSLLHDRIFNPLKSVVYFLKAEPNGPIKIGYSTNYISRIATLKTACPWDLTFLGWVEGNQNTERRLHRQFHHLRLKGEWFKPEESLMEFIRTEAKNEV